MKEFIIQKFGGTSVGHPERLCSLSSIASKYFELATPILVVSAVSGSTKSEGTTSLLIEAVDLASRSKPFNHQIDKIKLQHLSLVKKVCSSSFEEFVEYLESELAKLESFLVAVSTIKEKSPKSLDYVLSFGEKLSAALVTFVLKSFSINARFVDLSEVFDSFNIEDSYSSYDELARIIANYISPKQKEVSVCTGFIGYLEGGILSKVGRGYSDLTAALIARGLGFEKVEELQIWKEVDGVYTADPRRVSDARVLKELSAREAVELTFFGSEVIHPHTMEQVTSKNIPIRVLNSLKPESSGTIIKNTLETNLKNPIAITVKKDVVVLSVTSNRMYDARGFLAKLFSYLDQGGLVVDLVSTSEVTVSCTVNDVHALRKIIPMLETLGDIDIVESCAILSLVGFGLSKDSKAIGLMFDALAKLEIVPEMITQAESKVSISCVLKESQVEEALKAVHQAVF